MILYCNFAKENPSGSISKERFHIKQPKTRTHSMDSKESIGIKVNQPNRIKISKLLNPSFRAEIEVDESSSSSFISTRISSLEPFPTN